MSNVLVQSGIGSTDWTGGRAPAGGSHTGLVGIVMQDQTLYQVTHSEAEVRAKLGTHQSPVVTGAPPAPSWVAFDQPNSGVPIILDVNQVVQLILNPAELLYPAKRHIPSSTLRPVKSKRVQAHTHS